MHLPVLASGNLKRSKLSTGPGYRGPSSGPEDRCLGAKHTIERPARGHGATFGPGSWSSCKQEGMVGYREPICTWSQLQQGFLFDLQWQTDSYLKSMQIALGLGQFRRDSGGVPGKGRLGYVAVLSKDI